MAVNQMTINNQEIFNLTNDTVSPSNLAEGETAHDKSGNLIIGEMKAGAVNSVNGKIGDVILEAQDIKNNPVVSIRDDILIFDSIVDISSSIKELDEVIGQ